MHFPKFFQARPWARLCATFCALALLPAKADIAADYAAVTSSVQALTVPTSGSPGSVVMFGKSAFPVLLGAGSYRRAVMGVGRYGDSDLPAAGRAVAYAHTGFFDTAAGTRSTLFGNAVLWAGKQPNVGSTVVAIGSGAVPTSFFTDLGYAAGNVKSVTTSVTAANLTGVHVLVLNLHSGYTATAVTNIRNFAAAGGSVVICATPWALSTQAFADGNSILDPYGLAVNGSGVGDDPFTIPAVPYSAYYSARNGTGDLLKDKEGTLVMSAADKVTASNAIDQVLEVRGDIASLNADLDLLSDAAHYGWITPTAAAPLSRASKPVEAMLARYQSNKFDAMTSAELFVHPCTADFPGLPTAGATTVSRTVAINGNTFPDFYMNHGERPTRVETGVYAPPGATVTITIPANRVGSGLLAHIAGNGSEDQTWNIGTWTFFPKLWRRVPPTATTTQTGSVFGGLISILVPPNSNLGTFDITVSGALEAPCFTLGQNTDAEWNSTLKNKPAPYGFLRTDKLTLYVSKNQLQRMTNPVAVATHWKKTMDTADEYYGYTPFRKRAEVITSARYVAAGAAYASYPIEAGWGVNEDEFLNAVRARGSWGNYHELGHNYQDIFDGAFVIPTHAEVDVNLFPGMIYTLVHDRTAWDGPTHGTYDGAGRASDRANFMALPAASQTWDAACGRTMAYDFYFNLADAFGWQAYKTAFTRLMLYLQNPSGSTDTVLKNLSSSDPNFKRNRFYILMCDATGRNLDTYFQRYGLGVTGLGFEITASVKTAIAAKGYPVWIDNSDIDSLTNPGTLSVAEDALPDTEIYQFNAVDAEEPGTIWDYSITGGNTGNAFSIDKRTGKLRVRNADAEAGASYNLTVTVKDNGVPRFTKTSTFTVNVANRPEVPRVTSQIFTTTSGAANGSTIGTVTAAVESGRTLTGYAIVSGNDGHFAINAATGAITVTNAGTLPNPGVVVLRVSVTDSQGQTGYGSVTIACNTGIGVLEERWTGSSITGSPGTRSIFSSFTSTQNVAENYVRRVSGWLVPQRTGLYQFWIASDDEGSLWLSPDSDRANAENISIVDGYVGFQTWTSQSTQQSRLIQLEAGRAYYIEAIQRESNGGDHVSVAWEGPGITRGVIPGAVLIPAGNTSGTAVTYPAVTQTVPSIDLTAPADGASLVIPGTFTVSAVVTANANSISKVQFLDGTTVIGEDFLAPYSIDWVNPGPGQHTLKARLWYAGGSVDSSVRSIVVASVGPPIVTITSPAVASTSIPSTHGVVLEATVIDDTPATLTTLWSKVSGPGTVTFENASSKDTTATFSAPGTYVLRLTADDGSGQTTADVTITSVVRVPSVTWNPTGTDIGTVASSAYAYDAGANTHTITGASAGISSGSASDNCQTYLQTFDGDFEFKFQVSGPDIGSASNERLGAVVRSASTANAVSAFVGFDTTPTRWGYWITRATVGANNVQTTPTTSWNSATSWVRIVRVGSTVTGYYGSDGSTWSTAGSFTLAGSVVAGPCWSSNRAATSGTATFTNFSLIAGPPPLGYNLGAVVNAGADQTLAAPATASLVGSVGDDALPAFPGMVTTTWVKASGPGSVTFSAPSALPTTAIFGSAGDFVLRLIADDGEVKTFDDVAVSVTGPVVTLAVTDAAAAETGLNPGSFSVTRTGPTTDPLVVNYQVGGTATAGTDYQALSGSVSIPAGAASATITVGPLADALVEGPETVVLTLGAGFYTFTATPATVTIADSNHAPVWAANPFSRGNGQVGSAYAGTLVGMASDPDGNALTFTKVSGPAWLEILADGSLQGTPLLPADAGAKSFVVCVADSFGLSADATLNLTVTGMNWSSWRQLKFGADAANVSVSGDAIDTDRDGVSNLLEYAMNTEPKQATSYALPLGGMQAGNLTLTYRKNLAASDLTFVIQESTALGGWGTAAVTEEVVSDDGLTRVIRASVLTGGDTRKFLRLKVIRP